MLTHGGELFSELAWQIFGRIHRITKILSNGELTICGVSKLPGEVTRGTVIGNPFLILSLDALESRLLVR